MLIIICFLVGIMLLLAGVKIMLNGLENITKFFHISSLVTGLTVIAFGTSIPELFISLKAFYSGYNDIVIFTTVGSNIINILLILGLLSFVKPLKITNSVIKNVLPLSIISTLLFCILSLDDVFTPYKNNLITKSDALVLILFFMIYIYYMATLIKSRKEEKVFENENLKSANSLFYSIFVTILGFAMIFVGSIFIVDMAHKMSSIITLKFLSLSVIALVTSIPELITCFYFLKNNNEDLVIGDILGSNIFNICITIALPVIIMGNLNVNALTVVDIVNLVISSLILFLFAPIKQNLSKSEGIIMIIIFIIYYSFVLWEGLGI